MSSVFKKKDFFLVVLILGTLFVTLTTVNYGKTRTTSKAKSEPKTQTFAFERLNAITLFSPVLDTGLTARDVCVKTGAGMIYRWDNEDTHLPIGVACIDVINSDFLDYELIPYSGYFIDNHPDSSFMISGNPANPSYSVDSEGIYLYAFPEARSGDMTAQHICDKFSKGSGKPKVEIVWDIYMDHDVWHYCSDPGTDNFTINPEKPYYFQVSAGTGKKVSPRNMMNVR